MGRDVELAITAKMLIVIAVLYGVALILCKLINELVG